MDMAEIVEINGQETERVEGKKMSRGSKVELESTYIQETSAAGGTPTGFWTLERDKESGWERDIEVLLVPFGKTSVKSNT